MAINANESKVWGVIVELVTKIAQSNLLEFLPFGWLITKSASASKALGDVANLAQRVEMQGVDFQSFFAPLSAASTAVTNAQQQVETAVADAVKNTFKEQGIQFEEVPPTTPPAAPAPAPAAGAPAAAPAARK